MTDQWGGRYLKVKCRDCDGDGHVTDKLMCVGTLGLAPLFDGLGRLMFGGDKAQDFSQKECEGCMGRGIILVER